jgi:hypothetical protein
MRTPFPNCPLRKGAEKLAVKPGLQMSISILEFQDSHMTVVEKVEKAEAPVGRER